ncbi:type IV secretory system conjugative DNA transfer family protein [uncultured Sulfitobacter sp.]|uniref:type IV secretory system conjugative DNA transfer family protein n=1 Tax=uncultured Sulfitobacter sp. TaxID=191468 RepID=UPI0026366914|nr:type IV secretory system conjugative DNA transfer family protein [uncultured Sulfitobacter sp.]
MKNRLLLGTDENYLDHDMDVNLREEHMHVLGAPSQGKSRFLLSLIQQDIQYRRGFCLIDPHGELVDHVKDWLAKNEQITNRRTVHILDFKDLDYSFGFDPLRVDFEHQIEANVERTVNAIATSKGGDDISKMPLLESTLTSVCIALSYAGLTLTEAFYLLDPYHPEERHAITDTIKNRAYKARWNTYNEIAVRNPKLYLEEFRAAERRLTSLTGNRFLNSIVGQKEKNLNLLKAMDAGDMILVDLSQSGGYVPPRSANLFGRLLVSSFVGSALQREARVSRPFNLYIDEVHNFLSGDIPTLLAECRKFGLHLTMAHQYLHQLIAEGDLIYKGVMATARNKVCFAIDDSEDAEVMQRRIFAGHYDLERPKRSMDKPVVIGHEIIELESHGIGQSKATTEGTATAQAVSHMEGQGITRSTSTSLSETTSDSLAHSSTRSSGKSQSHNQGTMNSSSSGSGTSVSSGASETASIGMSSGMGATTSAGTTTATDAHGNPEPAPTSETMAAGGSLSMMSTSNAGAAQSHNSGVSTSGASGSGASASAAHGTNQSISEGITASRTQSRGISSSEGVAESTSTAQGSTSSKGISKGAMQGNTSSQGRSQSLRPILEERHTVLFSLEELKHQFTDAILTLPKRSAFVVIAGEGMAKIETLDVPDIKISGTRRARVLQQIREKSPIHRPNHEVEFEIEERMKRFMNSTYRPILEDIMNPDLQDKPMAHSEQELPQLPDDSDPMNPTG